MVNTMPGIEVDTLTIGTRITVTSGDFVKMEPSDLKFASSCIARVERLYQTPERGSVMLVRWYYRPEDTPEGRKPFHGLKELFLSDRYDVQRANSIRYKYMVHSLEKFLARENVGADDYFCRYEYMTASKLYIPKGDRVECKCGSPLNPDPFMLQCSGHGCNKWFHPSCLNLTINEARRLNDYVCRGCPSKYDQYSSVEVGAILYPK